jgi:hypothetical protein
VLVQRETERERSPLVSIARVSAGRGAGERNGDWHEEAGGRKLQLVSRGDQGGSKSLRSVRAVGWA